MLYKRQATTFISCPPLELFSKILLFIVPPNYEMGFSPLHPHCTHIGAYPDKRVLAVVFVCIITSFCDRSISAEKQNALLGHFWQKIFGGRIFGASLGLSFDPSLVVEH